MMGVPGAVGANLAMMLLQPAAATIVEASSCVMDAPMRSSSRMTASAIACSSPDGEGISHSRAKRLQTSLSPSITRWPWPPRHRRARPRPRAGPPRR